MNKGLFVHIIAFVISVLTICYVVRGDDSSIGIRVVIIIFLLFGQLIAGFFNSINDNYGKRI
ncbi:MAG: hypothetical protein ACOVNU_02760 [Candidatus Kapaibacteriota bacterium]